MADIELIEMINDNISSLEQYCSDCIRKVLANESNYI